MSAIPSEPSDIDPTSIPDIRQQPLGGATSAPVILKRVQKKGAEVPVAAFQSSI